MAKKETFVWLNDGEAKRRRHPRENPDAAFCSCTHSACFGCSGHAHVHHYCYGRRGICRWGRGDDV